MSEKNYKELFRDIKTFVFDVDGVLTNGNLLVMPNGDLLRTMSVRDGYALQLAVRHGYRVIVITGGRDESVKLRLNRIGVEDVVLKAHEKLPKLEEFAMMYDLKYENMLYMGDDMPDIPPMEKVALPCAPADAAPQVKQAARYISPFKGGEGCARDVIEQVLKVQGNWREHHFSYYKA